MMRAPSVIPAKAGIQTIGLAAFACLLAIAVPARAADDCTRGATFADAWTQLDTQRGYRNGFAVDDDSPSTPENPNLARRKRGNKSYDEIVAGYPLPKLPNEEGYVPFPAGFPRTELRAVLGAFANRLNDIRPSVVREAACGFRETLNEIMAGEALIGNARLLQGLRARYPGAGDPEDPDQRALLTHADAIFRDALELAADQVRQGPERLRSSGTVNLNFPFFVENTPRLQGQRGEIVEDDYFRFTELVTRAGLAGNSLGRRLFFQASDDDDDNGRANAAAVFKRTAQSVYLSAALLGAAQSARDFQLNNGAEVKRQVNDAEQTFTDVRLGFNPLTLRGDFVPNAETDKLLTGLVNLVNDARDKETAAKELLRRYDEDQSTLATELLEQTKDGPDNADILLGIIVYDGRDNDHSPAHASCDLPEQTNCDMGKPEDREQILAFARDPKYLCGPQIARDPLDCRAFAVGCTECGCDATICTNYVAYIGAQIELQEAERAMFNFTEQIRIEEERSGTVTRLTRDFGIGLAALDVAQGAAITAAPDIDSDSTVTFSPSAAVEGLFNAARTGIETVKEIRLEENESDAIVKNLLLEQATQAVAVRRAKLAVTEAHRNYTASIGDLVRFMRNAATASDNFAQAYFTNPAYRMQLDRAQQEADKSFEDSLIKAYETTKALEYEWATRLENPIRNQEPSLPGTTLGATYEAIQRAESVFAVASAGSAGSPSPTLKDYVLGLEQWDDKMRQVIGPQRQPGQTVTISLKKDIFGIDSPDEAFNRLAFRNRIAKGRRPGANPNQDDLILEFPLQVGDASLLPTALNLKIIDPEFISDVCAAGVSVNLRTVPGRELRTAASTNPPLVDLIMHDQFVIRSFYSQVNKLPNPGPDDFVTIKLGEARDAAQSLFAATNVQASIDCPGPDCQDNNVSPSCQLANRSPGVSRWELRILGSNGVNRDLNLENLDDIELIITYSFGQPVEFEFPQL